MPTRRSSLHTFACVSVLLSGSLIANAPTANAQTTGNGIFVPVEPEPINDAIARLIRPGATASTLTLCDLPNETVLITTRTTTSEGTVKYLLASASKKDETYEVTQDYMKYVSLRDADNRIVRYGITLRVKAHVYARSASIDLGGLLPIGVAANRGRASGSLVVEIAGIQSRDVTNALPLPAQLSQESVIAAITAAATIKSRIYDGFDGVPQSNNSSPAPRTKITIQRIAIEILPREQKQVEGEAGVFTVQ